MFFDMHHIISDGTSINILMKELELFYKGELLPPLTIQYKDFAHWYNSFISTLKKQQDYWMNTLGGELPVLNMPLDYQRPYIQSFHGDRLGFNIDKELTLKLKHLCYETGITLYIAILAAYNSLLYRYTGQEDIIIGSPVAGRRHADIQELIGMFVNTIPMRNYPRGDKTFREFLSDVKENTLAAFENQDYPFEEIVNRLNIRRDMSRNPIFDTMFVFQNADVMVFNMGGLKFSPLDSDYKISKFDITLNALERKDELYFEFEYSTKLFRKDSIERLRDCFLNILTDIVKNPGKKLCDLEILSFEEKHKILFDFNNTGTDYPKEKNYSSAV